MALVRKSSNNLNSWLPVRSIMDDFNKIPGVWDDMTSNFTRTLSADMWEEEEAVYIKVALPGMNPEAVDISVVGDTVTIKGEMEEEENDDDKKRDYYQKQIKYGSFVQSFTIPTSIDSSNATASFDKGMLIVKLPKSEAAKPKQIKVEVTKK